MNISDAKPRPIFSWRLIYAFTVVWLAAFAVMSPLVRREPIQFRSTAELRYALDDERNLKPEELLALLKTAVNRIAAPEHIAAVRDEIVGPANASTKLGTEDLLDIRRRMSITQINRGSGLRLAVSFRGKGGADDRDFVNQLANKLAMEIPRVSETMTSLDWVRATMGQIDWVKQVHLAEQIRAEIAHINEAIVDLRGRLGSKEPAAVTAQIEELERQQNQLRSTQGVDASHPQFVELQQKIEALRAAAYDDPGFRPVQVGSTESAESGDAIKNRFYNASHTTEPANPSTPLATRLAQIDLTRIGSTANQIKLNAEAMNDLRRDLDAVLNQPADSSERPLATLATVRYASAPTMVISSTPAPTWLLICPCVIAAMVTIFYNPLRDRLQLRTIGEVAKILRVNIVGEMPNIAARPTRRSERMAAWMVRGAEYSLLLLGFIMVLTCAMKPQILTVTLSNPLLALSNWYWLMGR